MGMRKRKPTVKNLRDHKYSEFPTLRILDKAKIPYVLGAYGNHSALWTGHCFVFNVNDYYDDPAFFHEFLHWVAASPAQRNLPDFGIGRQVDALASPFTSSSTACLYDDQASKRWVGWPKDSWTPRRASVSTAESQETVSSAALVAYEPFVGLCGWDEPPSPHDLSTEFFEFNLTYDFPVFNKKLRKRAHVLLKQAAQAVNRFPSPHLGPVVKVPDWDVFDAYWGKITEQIKDYGY